MDPIEALAFLFMLGNLELGRVRRLTLLVGWPKPKPPLTLPTPRSHPTLCRATRPRT